MVILSRASKYIFFGIVFLFFFVPLTWLILASLNGDPTYSWEVPKPFTAENYTDLFREGDVVVIRLAYPDGAFTLDGAELFSWRGAELFVWRGPEVFLWMKNSFILAFGTMICTVILATLAAYPLSRVQFPGKIVFMYLLLLARVMPIAAVIIPIFSIAIILNLINTFFGAILLFTAMQLPISLWIMKGFVDSIPIELEESAWLDGCGRFGALVRIVFPLMGPGVAVVGLFAFLAAWGDFFIPLVLLRDPDKFPIAMGLFRAFDERGNANFGMLTALAVFYSMPSIILYLLARQYLVKGLMSGGVKG